MAKVEVYTADYCPHCVAAKNLLAGKGVEFEEIDVTTDQEGRAKLMERSGGRRTIPQIFINGQHIGGNDDLQALNREGKLDPLLND